MKYAKFYYLDRITTSNNVIPFFETAGVELDAMIPTGYYTPTSICAAISLALSTVGSHTYTASFNRTTRQITISSTANFGLMRMTSDFSINSPFQILGLSNSSTTTDLSGASAYTGANTCGHQYSAQFPLQDYSSPDCDQGYENATVLKSADGKQRELYTTGSARYCQMNLKYITSRNDLASVDVIRGNANGVTNARDFMIFATGQGQFEFMEDDTNVASFVTLALESTASSTSGTSFQLSALYNESMPDFYETGKMKMRVIE